MTKNIEITLTNKGFVYEGWTIEPYEDWISIKDQQYVLWFGAEKVVGRAHHWKKRTCLIELIEAIDNEATTD